jgi:haloacetate dehalogenase
MAGVTEQGVSPFLADFRLMDVNVRHELSIRTAVGGSGSQFLLLRGHPQTHVTWRKVVSARAERFTMVAADLRGYGDSSKPESGKSHVAYSKREMSKLALCRAATRSRGIPWGDRRRAWHPKN